MELRWRSDSPATQDRRTRRVPLPIPRLIVNIRGPVLVRSRRLYDLRHWPEGWHHEFEVLVLNPAMALLKAQGRFATFLIWQGAQFVAVTSGMLLVGQAWSHLGPLPIVAVYGLYHVVMSPIGVYLCVRGEGLAASAQMAIFVRPLVTAIIALVPVAGLYWVSSVAPVQWQRDTLIVLLVPIGMLMTYPPCLKRLDANTYFECWRFLEPAQRALARISLRRKP